MKALFLIFLSISLSLLAQEPLQRISFGSCAKETMPHPFWDQIIAKQPQLCILLGDNIYADTSDMTLMQKKYDQLAAKEGYQRLLETCPVEAIWDDHDYGLNDAGKEYPQKVESAAKFLDFFAEPIDSPRRKRPGIYGAKEYGRSGQKVQLLLLDTRYFRDPLHRRDPAERKRLKIGPYGPGPDPDATLLGEAQWSWLEEQLRRPAEIRIVASSIQLVANENGWETWGNFPRERQRFYQLIKETKAGGVIVISGDRHMAELSSDRSGDAPYPIYDLTSSGLTNAGGGRTEEPNPHRLAIFRGTNFGGIRIDWESTDPRIHLSIYQSKTGEQTLHHEIKLSELTF